MANQELNRQLEIAQRELRDAGYPVEHVHRLGEVLLRVSGQQVGASFAEFHNFAGRLPYSHDADYGALILEYLADTEATDDRRSRLYREALWRARWCATDATSAGEGYARAEHVDRLMSKWKDSEGGYF